MGKCGKALSDRLEYTSCYGHAPHVVLSLLWLVSAAFGSAGVEDLCASPWRPSVLLSFLEGWWGRGGQQSSHGAHPAFRPGWCGLKERLPASSQPAARAPLAASAAVQPARDREYSSRGRLASASQSLLIAQKPGNWPATVFCEAPSLEHEYFYETGPIWAPPLQACRHRP